MERVNSSQKEYALEIFSSQAYLTVNKKLLIYYGPEVAIFLSNLIDRYKYFLDQEKLYNDWFFITHEKQMEQTGLTITKIRNCKNILINDHILKVDRRGTPAKEWYLIRFTKLLQIILPLPASRQETVCQDVRLRDEYNKTNNNNKNITKKEIKAKPSKKERAVVFLPLAQYLSKIICSNKNMKHTPQQLHSWAYDICQLVEDNGITELRIKQALIWYEKNIGGQYIPVIESGKSLKEKFSKLEAAISRTNFKYSKEPEKKVMEYGEWWYLDENGKYYNKSGRVLM